MKALIITRSPISQSEKEKINNSNILKIAVNLTSIKADFRVFRDSEYWELYRNFPEKIVTWEYTKPHLQHKTYLYFKQSDIPNNDNSNELYFYAGTLTTAIDFAVKQGATDVLLIADNTVYSKDFQDGINKGISELIKHVNIYKYTENGNFNLEYKSIKEFIQ